MCYAAPRPRCSSYAQKALDQAIESGDQERIAKAREQFYLTPRGIKWLLDDGQVEKSMKCKAERASIFAQARSK